MIKFFRKIRYDLMEKNNTGKYLKYAIGEIVLVVIGILIALQINTWNEHRNNEKLKSSYVTSFISDLTKDSIQLATRIETNEVQQKLNKKVINLFNNDATDSNTIFNYMLNNEHNLGLRVKNTYNSNTFDLLISTGNIELFSNKFINQLMELNKLQKEQLVVTNSNSSIYFETYNNFRTKFTGSYQITNTKLIKNLWQDNDVNNSVVMYINLISQRDHTINRYIELSEKVQTKTQELLKFLRSEINL